MRTRAVLVCAIVLIACGCGSALPRPPVGGRPWTASDYVEVPYPPPAARVEIVPPRPTSRTVWVDGDWAWQSSRWAWEGGGWVDPPPSAHLSLSMTVRASDGRLFFVPSAWYDASGKPVARPRVLVAAAGGLGPETAATPLDAGN